MVLVKKLFMPGIPCDMLPLLIRDKLKLTCVPFATIEKLTSYLDMDNSGFLEASEFISMFHMLFSSHFPTVVAQSMNVTNAHLAAIIGSVLLNLILVFALITFVITAFTNGQGVAQVIHTVCSTFAIAGVKGNSDSKSAEEEVNIINWAKERVRDALCNAMGLSKNVRDAITVTSKKKSGATA